MLREDEEGHRRPDGGGAGVLAPMDSSPSRYSLNPFVPKRRAF